MEGFLLLINNGMPSLLTESSLTWAKLAIVKEETTIVLLQTGIDSRLLTGINPSSERIEKST